MLLPMAALLLSTSATYERRSHGRLGMPYRATPSFSLGSLSLLLIMVTPHKPSKRPLMGTTDGTAVAMVVAMALVVSITAVAVESFFRRSVSAIRSCTVMLIRPSDREPRRFSVILSSASPSSSSSSSSCTMLHFRIRPVCDNRSLA